MNEKTYGEKKDFSIHFFLFFDNLSDACLNSIVSSNKTITKTFLHF
jgi:hypothetical protein